MPTTSDSLSFVETDELSLVLELNSTKYKYNLKIHDAEEKEYLKDRYNSFLSQGTLEKYLTEEFNTIS